MSALRPLFLSLVVVGLQAADPDDLTVNDLRLQVGLPPDSAEATTNRTGSPLAVQGDVTWEARGRWTLQWAPPVSRLTPSGNGFCLLELTSLSLVTAEAADGSQLRERAVMAGLHLGLGWVILQNTTLEITGSGAAGAAWQENSGEYGRAWEVGARLGLTWAPDTGWGRPAVGAALLATHTQLDNTMTLAGRDYDLKLVAQGLTPAVLVGWRF